MTTTARALAVPVRPPLRVVIGPQTRRAPRLRGWMLLAVTVLTAFFLLIYSRIALDRSAFVLDEIEKKMELEEARYWELRLDAAHLQSPDRITRLARDMGMVFPDEVRTVEAPGVGAGPAGVEDRWVDLKALLSAQP